ncbi:hypothetical protein SAMN04487945_2650 [Halobacterium jilantaiense]|uniref:Uncharacterized protein n=1 Tax=Halobacterium jilantaiense TaxID=355548 RepID=A0A1I0QIQ7_9EURY|nr:hypothetical protein SAMN04487945_2650 [Halobacterium jilantaiense]
MSSDSNGDVAVLPERPPDDDPDCGGLDPIRRPSGGPFPAEAAGLELTASTDTVAIGDDITFSLRNHTDEETLVGTLHKYNIERQDGDAWRPVFSSPDREYYDIGVTLPPGGGYDWPVPEVLCAQPSGVDV